MKRVLIATLFALALRAPSPAQTPAPQTPRAPVEPMKPLYVLEDSYVGWRLLPSEQARHSTISNGAWKRIGDRGAAAIFAILAVPGNIRTQFYPVGTNVPCFSLGLQDGVAIRDLINTAKSGAAASGDGRGSMNRVLSATWRTLQRAAANFSSPSRLTIIRSHLTVG